MTSGSRFRDLDPRFLEPKRTDPVVSPSDLRFPLMILDVRLSIDQVVTKASGSFPRTLFRSFHLECLYSLIMFLGSNASVDYRLVLYVRPILGSRFCQSYLILSGSFL